ncbi:MAG: hypothetical protein V3V74_07685 [Nitrosomonadaceae bacterium]
MQQPFQCKGDDQLEVFNKLCEILNQHLDSPTPETYCRENSDEWYQKPLDQDD